MKRVLFTCSLFLLFSSLFAETRTELREVAGEVYVKYSSSPKSTVAKFEFISDNVLELKFEAEFEGIECYDITTYEDVYERKNRRSEWVKIKTNVKSVRTEDRFGGARRYQKKSGIYVPRDGYEVQITSPNDHSVFEKKYTIYATSLVKDGCIIFTDEIAKALFSIGVIYYVRINIPQMSLSGEVDIMELPFIAHAKSEVDNTLETMKKSVTNVSLYEDYAKKLLALKNSSPNPYLLGKVKEEFVSVRNSLKANLSKELDPLQGKYPEFAIVGTVQDYIEGTDATTFQIFGTTLPMPMTTTTSRHLGYQNKSCNIKVIISNATKNSNSVTWYGKSIQVRGNVYYTGRETGKTTDGKSVPVYVYCEPMKNTSSLIPGYDSAEWKRIQTLTSQINSIEKIYSQYAELLS